MLEIKERYPDVTDSEALTLRLLEQKHSGVAYGLKSDLMTIWRFGQIPSLTQETTLQEGQFAVSCSIDADLDCQFIRWRL